VIPPTPASSVNSPTPGSSVIPPSASSVIPPISSSTISKPLSEPKNLSPHYEEDASLHGTYLFKMYVVPSEMQKVFRKPLELVVCDGSTPSEIKKFNVSQIVLHLLHGHVHDNLYNNMIAVLFYLDIEITLRQEQEKKHGIDSGHSLYLNCCIKIRDKLLNGYHPSNILDNFLPNFISSEHFIPTTNSLHKKFLNAFENLQLSRRNLIGLLKMIRNDKVRNFLFQIVPSK
jgi:hypothetical protein